MRTLANRILPKSLRGQFALTVSMLAILMLTIGIFAIDSLRAVTAATQRLSESQLIHMQDAQDLVQCTLLIQQATDQLLITDSPDAVRFAYVEIISQLETLDYLTTRLASSNNGDSVLDLLQSSQLFRNIAHVMVQLRENSLRVHATFIKSIQRLTLQLQATPSRSTLSLVILLYRLQNTTRENEIYRLRAEFTRQLNREPYLLSSSSESFAPFSLRLKFFNLQKMEDSFHVGFQHQVEAMISAARQLSTYFTESYQEAILRLIEASRRIQYWLIGLLACNLLLTWLVVRVFLGRHVLTRLQQVSFYLRRGEGDGPRPIVPVQGADEIGDMARAVEQFLGDRRQLIRTRTSLEEEQRRLAAIFDNTADSIIVLQNGMIRQVNRAAEHLFDRSSRDMLGKNISEFMSKFDLSVEKISSLPTPVRVQDALARTQSNRVFPIEVSMSRVLTKESPLVILVIRDATLRKEVEKQLTTARDAALSARQAQSTFLANISHELRTPLNAILGYVQILNQETNLSEKQKNGLNTIQQSSEHLLMLINDLLDVSRIEAKKMELIQVTFDLSALLRQAYNIIKIKVEEKNVKFHYEMCTPLPKYVRGDERKLKQILLNLLDNAAKYTNYGEVILQVRYLLDSELFHCEVLDTGLGIPRDKLQIIFEPFVQLLSTGQLREGTGLGLNITKQLVILMHGKLGVESELGKGSLFWFEVPLPAVLEQKFVTKKVERGTIAHPMIGYQESGHLKPITEPFIIPPCEEMEKLYEFALRGDMRRIKAWAIQQKEKNKEYSCFSDRLYGLAMRFKADVILALVKQYKEKTRR